MIDQLIIGDKASFDDFRASLATRTIGMPTKKSIKETVPFSNVTYDFSKINGELYWDERELEYVFEITASTPEKLEERKAAFADWVMNVFQEEIHDPFIPDFHFVGTYDDMDFEDEESLDKTTVTVKLMAYPYKVANLPTVIEKTSQDYNTSRAIENNSSHPVVATVTVETEAHDLEVEINGKNEKVPAGTKTWEVILPVGVSDMVTVEGTSFTLTYSFVEEVF